VAADGVPGVWSNNPHRTPFLGVQEFRFRLLPVISGDTLRTHYSFRRGKINSHDQIMQSLRGSLPCIRDHRVVLALRNR
jgi:hypothetical protein